MRLLTFLLGFMLLFSTLTARASDDMQIYSDRFSNGWGDNSSYTTRYATNNPVQSGSNSMAIVPSCQWQAWWFKSSTKVDTRIYTNVTFWLYGETCGQTVGIVGKLHASGSGLPTV